jgi:hypothetical protein
VLATSTVAGSILNQSGKEKKMINSLQLTKQYNRNFTKLFTSNDISSVASLKEQAFENAKAFVMYELWAKEKIPQK